MRALVATAFERPGQRVREREREEEEEKRDRNEVRVSSRKTRPTSTLSLSLPLSFPFSSPIATLAGEDFLRPRSALDCFVGSSRHGNRWKRRGNKPRPRFSNRFQFRPDHREIDHNRFSLHFRQLFVSPFHPFFPTILTVENEGKNDRCASLV